MSEAFERVLRAAASRDGKAGVCPDPELLAAYVDGGVSGTERRAIETHAAECVSCQQHLALLGSLSVERERTVAPGSGWLKRWGLLVPVATAVVVIGVWVRLPPSEPAGRLTEPATAAQGASSAAETDATGGAAPLSQPKEAAAAAPTMEDRVHLSSPEADRQGAEVQAPPRVSGPAPENTSIGSGPRGAGAPTAASPPPPTSLPLSAPRAESPAATPEARPPERARESVGFAADAAGSAGLRKAEADASSFVVGTESRAESYRASGPRLEGSRDGGRTWQPVRSLAGGVFTTGTCADGACWFGTSDGHVERAAGGAFTRSTLPVREAVASIAAEGPLTAVATGAGGRRFRTTHGGDTWSEVR